ncbi:MAG: bifunctional folylpolyglutamate synthase/dihydrofolate synthase [Lachnospiraceae bacterium]|nr:bifunctional folylpolyglutamate synthase/dihydrofolate synthase [Lachnospiraceae bacterium]
MNQAYEEAVSYIDQIPGFAKKTGLSNTEYILKKLGDPHKKIPCIHVAGTNGKGSVSKMLSLMIRSEGKKTGLFTSPHLVRINERIEVNGEAISDEDFASCFQIVKNTVDEILKNNEMAGGQECYHPAYFEFLFLMAAVYFEKCGCEAVVYETGLGGRLDATNTVMPKVCVITRIGMDHMQYLGDTIESIAVEKAGIIKENIPVVIQSGKKQADEVLIQQAKKLAAAYFLNGYDPAGFLPKALPPYQYDNAATAIRAYVVWKSVMADPKAAIPDMLEEADANRVRIALQSFEMPARFDFLSENCVVDGGHNEDAILRFCEAVLSYKEKKGFQKLILVYGAAADKDYETVIEILAKQLSPDKVFVTQIPGGRALSATTAAEQFQKHLKKNIHRIVEAQETDFSKAGDILICEDYQKAWQAAKTLCNSETLLAASGSLYLAGGILRMERPV